MTMQEQYMNQSLVRFLNDACELEQVAVREYDKVLGRIELGDLKQTLSSFRDDAQRNADAIAQVIDDIGGQRSAERSGFVKSMAQVIERDGGQEPYRQFEDLEDLLTIEHRHRVNVEVLRILSDAADDPRLKGAADFMHDSAVERVSWLSAMLDEVAPIALLSGVSQKESVGLVEEEERAERVGVPEEDVIYEEEVRVEYEGEEPAV